MKTIYGLLWKWHRRRSGRLHASLRRSMQKHYARLDRNRARSDWLMRKWLAGDPIQEKAWLESRKESA